VALRIALISLVIVILASCKEHDVEPAPTIGSGQSQASAPVVAGPAAGPRIVQRDLLEELAWCDIRHRGLAIDVASNWADAHRGFILGPFHDVEASQRAAVVAAKVLTGKLVYDFWLDHPADNVHVEVRAQAEGASRLVVDVDDQRLGEQRLRVDELGLLRFGPVGKQLQAGRHTVTLRFRGRRKAGTVRGWLQWLRIHLPDRLQEVYVPPTKENLLQDVVLGDQPRRGIALRSPGSVRCPAFPVKGARLKLDVGYWGSGEGVAQVLVHTSEGRKIILAERQVRGDHDGREAKWTPLELSLDAFDQQLIALEFDAVEAGSGGRVVFAEPRLELKHPPRSETPEAQNVVVVIAGGLSRRLVPPWAERALLPNLSDITRRAYVFEGYRASSTAVSTVIATLLSGLNPNLHGLQDPAARLPESVQIVSESMRRFPGVSAFFTNVPYSFRAFGFEKGWNEFEQFSPVEDLPATEPLRRGRHWLAGVVSGGDDEKALLVMHVTGGHPPWDVSVAEAKTLPPEDYSGMIDARKGAVALREIRSRRSSRRRRLREVDWTRLEALQRAALAKVDESIGIAVESLEESGAWDDTLFVFMGDVAMGDNPSIPFTPLGRLDDSRLLVPLIVKFPGATEGEKVDARVGPRSVSRTLHEALGARWPGSESVVDLYSAAKRPPGLLSNSGQVAIQGHEYAFTIGPWRLSGALGVQPKLCDIEVDPACQTDLYAEHPFVVHWTWRAFQRAMQAEGDVPQRENAEIDPATRAALDVYGL
jgi:hypothetical protein